MTTLKLPMTTYDWGCKKITYVRHIGTYRPRWMMLQHGHDIVLDDYLTIAYIYIQIHGWLYNIYIYTWLVIYHIYIYLNTWLVIYNIYFFKYMVGYICIYM